MNTIRPTKPSSTKSLPQADNLDTLLRLLKKKRIFNQRASKVISDFLTEKNNKSKIPLRLKKYIVRDLTRTTSEILTLPYDLPKLKNNFKRVVFKSQSNNVRRR